MIILDAGVLIAFLEGGDVHHDAAMALLAREIDDDFAVSVITLAEVLLAPMRTNRVDDVFTALRDLEVAETALPEAAAVRLAELRAATGLKMPDCCARLAAEQRRARLATFDDALARAAGARGLSAITL